MINPLMSGSVAVDLVFQVTTCILKDGEDGVLWS